MLPLQVPGAPELVVVLLVILLLALPVVVLSVALVLYAVYVRGDEADEAAAGADSPSE